MMLEDTLQPITQEYSSTGCNIDLSSDSPGGKGLSMNITHKFLIISFLSLHFIYKTYHRWQIGGSKVTFYQGSIYWTCWSSRMEKCDYGIINLSNFSIMYELPLSCPILLRLIYTDSVTSFYESCPTLCCRIVRWNLFVST
jgi:hypothetical protein